MRRFLVGILAMVTLFSSFEKADFNVIPRVNNMVNLSETTGDFQLTAQTVIVAQQKELLQAKFLRKYIEERCGWRLQIVSEKPKNGGFIGVFSHLKDKNPEAYTLFCSKDGIVIDGASLPGVFYGIQTLRKALPIVKDKAQNEVTIPGVMICDSPRFSYRGAHLDVSRHFMTVEEVRRFIDMCALHNINRLHWHLTDDQGWRVKIKKYPKLTTVGAYRPETVIGHNSGKYDGTPHSGFYTQDDIRAMVKYAAQRQIIIIPEIDLPGHMQAALAAYPGLGCTGGPYEVWKMWGVSDNVLCAGNDQVLKFIDDVLREITELFPSKYIHIGGDECPKTVWKTCPKCQARIKANGLEADGKHSAEERLQSYVINHAEKFLNSLGRQIIGWDETLEGGLAPNATVMSWRGEAGGIEAAKQNHDVIMTPNTYLYFDYYQSKDVANEPEAIGGYLPLEKVYSYEPLPASLTVEEAKHIIGVQANLWTEYIPTFSQVEYMELPRMAALSEIQWCEAQNRDYNEFLERLPKMFNTYDREGYNYAKRVMDLVTNYQVDNQKKTVNVSVETLGNPPIYYTLDGSQPTTKSTVYKSAISLDETADFRAVAVRDGEFGREVRQKVNFNLATACPITLLQQPKPKYTFGGANTLVDGISADDDNYSTGRWLGFTDNDLEAVIDFGKSVKIKELDYNVAIGLADWLMDARGCTLAVSDDGETFKEVASEDYGPMKETKTNGIRRHKLKFKAVNARYVKVKILSERSMPEWHSCKGLPGWLFVDEITIK